MSIADDRYNRSEKGRARWNKYARRVRYEAAVAYLRSLPPAACYQPKLTRREKLEAMAAQIASPFEAMIARDKLAQMTAGAL